MKQHYIYCYLDPRKSGIFIYDNLVFNFEPIYIGMGKNKRIEKHLCPCYLKNRKNLFFYNVLNKILSENIEPIRYKLYQNLTDVEALKLEIEYIKLIGRSDQNKGPLCNLTDGGEGGGAMKNRNHSIETKQKMSKSAKGRKFSEEHKKKLSEARKKLIDNGFQQYNKGKQLTEEHKQNLRKPKKKK